MEATVHKDITFNINNIKNFFLSKMECLMVQNYDYPLCFSFEGIIK